MYSIKPGRGPSLMGGIGGIAVAIFGLLWIGFAASMGAPSFFILFGVVFVLFAIGGAIYNFSNATARNRMSTFDVTRDDEEKDPIAEALGYSSTDSQSTLPQNRKQKQFEGEFCPFCGAKVHDDFDFCPKCGKDI